MVIWGQLIGKFMARVLILLEPGAHVPVTVREILSEVWHTGEI